MWDHVTLMDHSDGLGHVSLEVGSKNGVADPRLSKCHQLNIGLTEVDLGRKDRRATLSQKTNRRSTAC